MIKFDLDYWLKKLDTFTITEYKAGWKNSQLRDTQIITKYSLPYLKTVFQKVEVQKATVVDIFKEIYKVKLRSEVKDREKHSHHAIDAAVLTLIPTAPTRDKILLNYHELKDKNKYTTYHEPVRNWPNFNPFQLLSIEDEALINFQPQHRTLTPTYKNIRKRGKIQYLRKKGADGKWQYRLDEQGRKIPLKAKGDNIRGQLHKESFYGSIQLNGNPWLVERYPVASFTSINDCKHIVDDAVRKIVKETLEKRMAEGESFDKAKLLPIPFPNGKEVIKKVRCKVAAGKGYLTPGKALEVKKHAFSSKHTYKQYVYAQNEENTLCLYYQDEKNTERAFRIVGLFDLAQLKLKTFNSIHSESYYQSIETGRGKNKKAIPLEHIIYTGSKVLLYENSAEELKELPKKDLLRRLYRVYKFNEPSAIYIYLQHHLEARSNEELGNGETEIIFDTYQPRIFLNAAKFKCVLENKHFKVSLDGEIHWLI